MITSFIISRSGLGSPNSTYLSVRLSLPVTLVTFELTFLLFLVLLFLLNYFCFNLFKSLQKVRGGEAKAYLALPCAQSLKVCSFAHRRA